MSDNPGSHQNNDGEVFPSQIIPISVSRQADTGDSTLRAELHAAIDRVLSTRRGAAFDREGLKSELRASVDRVLNQHTPIESQGSGLAQGTQSARSRVQGVPENIDAAMARLDALLQERLAAAGPGMKRGTWAAAQQAQKLVPVVVGVLAGIADDPEKMRKARQQLETLLSRYMSPNKALSLVNLAVSALEAALKKRKP